MPRLGCGWLALEWSGKAPQGEFIHWVPHGRISDSFTPFLTHSFIDSFANSFIHSLIAQLIYSWITR